MDTQQLKNRPIEDILVEVNKQLNKHKLTAWEYNLDTSCGWALEYLNGKIEKLEQCQTRSLSITIYQKQQRGSCSTNVLESAAIAEAIEQAYSSARYAEPDTAVGIADPDLMAWQAPHLPLLFEATITPAQAIAMASLAEREFLTKDKRIIKSGGIGFDSVAGSHCYANSSGFVGSYEKSYYAISGGLLAKDSQGMQRDNYYDIACNPNRLLSLDEIMQHTFRRVINRLEATHLTPRRCPVVYCAELVPTLLGSLVAAASGYNLYLGNSFLLNRLNSKIFPENIQIIELPLMPEALSSAPFDGDGVALHDSPLIENGLLTRYLLDSYTARKLGMTTTGNAGGVRNLTVQPTVTGGLDALLAKMDTGLLVTELYNGNQNVLNGDYSCGAFGYWVEHGQIQYPVKELTLAGNLLDMFNNLIMAGDDTDYRHSIISGSVVIAEMTVASSSC